MYCRMREGWKRKASLLRRDRLRMKIINVELLGITRGLAADSPTRRGTPKSLLLFLF
jgi:hypothetical protein